jgi:hypothetical protein
MMSRLRAHTAEIEAEGPDWWRTEPLNGPAKKPAKQQKPGRKDAA